MMKFFNHPHFENIMQAVDPVKNKLAFDVACQNAGLMNVEIEWLWNYLKEFDSALCAPLPEAAASGW